MDIRTYVTTTEEVLAERGRPVGRTVRRSVCTAVLANPFARRHGEDLGDDLGELEVLGAELAEALATRAFAALAVPGDQVTAYGKGAIVGTDGELEHAAALLHPRFGAPVRTAIGGGAAIIPSTKKVAGPGASLTVPLTSVHDIWSFDEMDAIEVRVEGAPRADELLVCLAYATGGRPFARTRKPS